jgi:putative ABC transport system permease protein
MQDLRLAIRALRTTPVVSAVAILSLALGIGANTAIFSIVDSLLLRMLPVVEPHRLAGITTPRILSLGGTAGAWPYPVWQQIHQRQLFDGEAAWGPVRFNLTSSGETRFVDGLWVSGSYFETLGVPALLGRTLTEADDQRGGGANGAVAVIGHGFWRGHFGGTPDVLGRTLTLDNVPFTIVGVTPPDFFGADVGRSFDVIAPIGAEPLVRGRDSFLDRAGAYFLLVLVRLKAGQTIESANAALRGVQSQIRDATLPSNVPKQVLDRYLTGTEGFAIVPAATGNSRLRGQYQRPLLTIMVVVALVLLIACANIANLLLARATARRHELSVRLALGASRWRLARLLLAESAALALMGAALGTLMASWGSRLVVRQLSTQANTVFLDLSMDRRVLAFTTAITVVTALLFGVAPALRASAVAPMEALKEHGRGMVGAKRFGLGSGLVIAQVGLSVVLIVSAGLFIRSFISLAGRSLGFDRDRVLLVNINAQRATVDPAQRLLLFERTRGAVRAVPGVANVALSIVTPVQGGGIINNIEVSGGVSVPPTLVGGIANTWGNVISPGWFSTVGIPLLAGRDFTGGDRKDAPSVAIVNQAVARTFLNGASPLGHTLIQVPFRDKPIEIVGVVADAAYGSLRDAAAPTVYTPLVQWDSRGAPVTNMNLVIRSHSATPALLTKSIAAAIVAINSQLALTFRPLADQVNAGLIQERLVALLAGFFGGLALLLAALGLYGVTAYAVSRRRHEIGIRMALGAAPAGVVRLVLRRVFVLVGIGVVIGTAASMWASQFVASLLYGLEPRDPATLIGAILALTGVGALAGWLPARRASRIEPAEVLRNI